MPRTWKTVDREKKYTDEMVDALSAAVISGTVKKTSGYANVTIECKVDPKAYDTVKKLGMNALDVVAYLDNFDYNFGTREIWCDELVEGGYGVHGIVYTD